MNFLIEHLLYTKFCFQKNYYYFKEKFIMIKTSGLDAVPTFFKAPHCPTETLLEDNTYNLTKIANIT
jgi:hypothetical protein